MTTSAGDLLLETARRGDLPHAIILHGPSPAHLSTLALGLAKAANCLNATIGDDCSSCQKINRRSHPDVHFIEVTGEKKMISVEQIRDLVAAATLRPYEGRNKVFLIDPADGLTTNGSNALLKTLEEPARDTLFILLTRSPDLLLPTIRSRSQAIYIGGETERRGGASAHQIRAMQLSVFEESERDTASRDYTRLLERYISRNDSTALLAIAAAVAASPEPREGMALLALILSGESPETAAIPRQRRLMAADLLLAGIDAVRKINADARLMVEGALAKLI